MGCRSKYNCDEREGTKTKRKEGRQNPPRGGGGAWALSQRREAGLGWAGLGWFGKTQRSRVEAVGAVADEDWGVSDLLAWS
ncbi:hypothetical protein AXG93_3102s1570 [Marchantia polymorpha subsp. ruderalis]|uniref:Uncharacterized protein n=1 Tax=Marchantia polymorpha subsp. ruderalis TaxID=1480154 RepID=A0A176W8B9_MARPO|nr:hypothetical protein AXG93_3102s1570 [Marchantia polymorpha subsp. ruderalis]